MDHEVTRKLALSAISGTPGVEFSLGVLPRRAIDGHPHRLVDGLAVRHRNMPSCRCDKAHHPGGLADCRRCGPRPSPLSRSFVQVPGRLPCRCDKTRYPGGQSDCASCGPKPSPLSGDLVAGLPTGMMQTVKAFTGRATRRKGGQTGYPAAKSTGRLGHAERPGLPEQTPIDVGDHPRDYPEPIEPCGSGWSPGLVARSTPCFQQVVGPSPARPGPYRFDATPFEPQGLQVRVHRWRFPVRGQLYMPQQRPALGGVATKDGERFPLVILAHGQHSAWLTNQVGHPSECAGRAITECTFSASEICDRGDLTPLLSYQGYDYLQAALASHGVASLSLDLNCVDEYYVDCWFGGACGVTTRDSVDNLNRRWRVIVAALRYLEANSRRYPLDLSLTGLLGHSRGGGACIDAADYFEKLGSGGSTIRIRAVAALAPLPLALAAPSLDSRYALLSFVPTEDEDVDIPWSGAVFYDYKRPTPFKCHVYVRGGNHKSFNRHWSYAWVGERTPTMLSDRQHEDILAAYGTAFFRLFLRGQRDQLDYLMGKVLPRDVMAAAVDISFQIASPEVTTIEDFERADPLRQANVRYCGHYVRDHVFSAVRDPVDPPDGRRVPPWAYGMAHEFIPWGRSTIIDGFTKGLVVSRGGWRLTLNKPLRLTGAEIWIRAALLPMRKAADDRNGRFFVGVHGPRGTVTWASSDAAGGLQRPHRCMKVGTSCRYPRGLLKTFRFPAACFSSASPLGEDLVTAITIWFDEGADVYAAFDDVQIVGSEAGLFPLPQGAREIGP